MSPSAVPWSVTRLGRIPVAGMVRPASLREKPGRLTQRNHWVYRAAGAPALVFLTMGLGLSCNAVMPEYYERPRKSVESWPSRDMAFAGILLGAGGLLLRAYAGLPGGWVLDRRRQRGTVFRRGWPFTRKWRFPLAAVNGVSVADTGFPAARRGSEVGLALRDSGGYTAVVLLGYYRKREAAKAAADRIALWLGEAAAVSKASAPSLVASVELPRPLDLAVPAAPLGAPKGTRRNPTLVRSKDGQTLCFRMPRGQRLVAFSAVALGACVTVGGIVLPFALNLPSSGMKFFVSLGIILCALGGTGWMGRFVGTFDRRKAEGCLRWGFRRRTVIFPLAEIAAVQILHAGVEHPQGEEYRVFEVNLVFSNRRRINVSRITDATKTRTKGRQLAQFLRVPLVDQMGGL